MAGSDEFQAVVAGHICLDIIPDLSRWPVPAREFFMPGKLVEVGPATLATGGCVPNTGLALLTLGIPSVLMGKIGEDPFGKLVQMIVEQRGTRQAREGLIVVPGEATAYTVVLSPGGEDRMFLHMLGANSSFGAGDIDYERVAAGRLFHLGYPPYLPRLLADEGRELVEVFRRVKALGVTTSLDMAMPDARTESGRLDWRALLGRVLPYVDIFLPSAEEILFAVDRPRYDARLAHPAGVIAALTGDDLSRVGACLLEMGTGIAGVKCGERGLYMRTAGMARLEAVGKAQPQPLRGWADRELWEPTFHVANFAGTTGAGDTTIAGFLAAYLRGHGMEDCLHYATAVGAFNVTAPDALSGLRPWSETVSAVQAGWAKNPLEITGAGWREAAERSWHGPND